MDFAMSQVKKPLKSALKKPKPAPPIENEEFQQTGGKEDNVWADVIDEKAAQPDTEGAFDEDLIKQDDVPGDTESSMTEVNEPSAPEGISTETMETEGEPTQIRNKKDRPPVEKMKCEVCNIWVSGPVIYTAHLQGKPHARNVLLREKGVKIKGKIGIGNRRARVINTLKNCREPTTGLQFLCEFQDDDTNVAPRYVCTLCETCMEKRLLIGHLTGKSHRYKYMAQCYPDKAQVMANLKSKTDKQAYASQTAIEIEELEGGKKLDCIKVSNNCDPFAAERRAQVKQLTRGGPSHNYPMIPPTADVLGGMLHRGVNIMDIIPLIEACDISSQEEASAALQINNVISAKLLDFNSQSLSQSVGRGRGRGGVFGRGGVKKSFSPLLSSGFAKTSQRSAFKKGGYDHRGYDQSGYEDEQGGFGEQGFGFEWEDYNEQGYDSYAPQTSYASLKGFGNQRRRGAGRPQRAQRLGRGGQGRGGGWPY